MDFHSLARKELQTLCKKNKIPANMTNVAMADALAALPQVEGIDDFLNVEESEAPESPKKEEIVCSEVPRTALRTSTRRKAIKEEPKSSQPLTRTRRGTGSKCVEEPNQENKDLSGAFTPALPSGRRRTAATSACKKVDFRMTVNVENDNNFGQEKNEIHETPAVPNSQKRVAGPSARRKTETRNNGTTEQRVTRRSIRLLEKNMESLSLMEDGKTEPIAVHLSFEEMPKSTGLEKEANVGIESKKLENSESKSDGEENVPAADNDTDLEINDQEKNETVAEPETDASTFSAAKHGSEKSSNDETSEDVNENETDVPTNNLDMKYFSKDEGTEASKDNAPEVSAEDINNAAKFSLPLDNMDLAKADNVCFVGKSDTILKDGQIENICESEDTMAEDFDSEALETEEAKVMNDSAKLSLPQENVEEVTEVDVLSTAESVTKESICESDSTMGEKFGDKGETLDADIEEDTKDLEMVSVQVENVMMNSMEDDNHCTKVDQSAILTGEAFHYEETCNNVNLLSPCLTETPTAQMAEYVPEDLVDVKIQFLMDKAPEDRNDTLDSQPKMLDNIKCETLVDVSVTAAEEFPISSNISRTSLAPFAADQLAGQFPRPTILESPVKEQTTELQLDILDAAEDDVQEQIVENKDVSLRQLRKMFKEQLQLSKKKMDKSKVANVRTALQPLPENRMDMNELENRF